MAWYAICRDEDYDIQAQVCTQVAYVDVAPSSIPELSREEGALLGGAIFSLLFTAWAFRFLRRRTA